MCKKSFTLLEIIVAFFVLTVVFSMVAGILFSVQKSWQMQQELSRQLQRNVNIDTLSDHLFRNAVPFFWPDENGDDQLVFNGTSTQLMFVTKYKPYKANNSGMRFVQLFLQDKKFYAKYRDEPFFVDKIDPLPNTLTDEILAPDVARIAFKYAYREGKTVFWTENWNAGEHNNGIPIAIDMRIKFSNGEELKILRRTAGNSSYSILGIQNENK